MAHRYLDRARITEAVSPRFLRHAAADLTAVQIAALTGLNRNTFNRLLGLLGFRMPEACEADSPFSGEVYAKTRLARCRGMHPHTFLFHLKGCQFRFNHRGRELYPILVNLCRRRPLSQS